MELLNARTKNHLRKRLTITAHKEVDEVLRMVKHHFPQLKGLRVLFEDVPTATMIKSGVKLESEYCYDSDKQELTLFLFNIYMAVENDSGEFKRRIRHSILSVAGDLVGEEMAEDC